MERKYYIYSYTNQVTGQKYIGCTHQSQRSRAGKNGSQYNNGGVFWDAIQQYGWSNFKFEVLEDNLTKEQVYCREVYWIDTLSTLYPNGYNLQSGGKHYKSNQRSISKLKGSDRSYLKDSRPYRYKRVKQLTKDGNLVSEYQSLSDASKISNISLSNISSCCNGNREFAGGYIWRFV